MVQRIPERMVWIGAAAIVLIAAAGVITYTRVQLLTEAVERVDDTRRMQYALERALSGLQQAESAVRGFHVTREDAFLKPYEPARAEFQEATHTLVELSAENRQQLEEIEQLERAGAQRFAQFDSYLRAIRNGTFVMPKPPVAAAEGTQLAEAIRARIRAMQAEVDERLARRKRLEADARNLSLFSIASMAGIAAALVVLLMLAERRSSQALRQSEERLRLALEGAELGAVDHDLRTGEAVWNDRLYSIVGYPPGTPLSGEMMNLRTAPEDWDRVLQGLQHANRAHVPFRSVHRIIRANDKAIRWISSTGTFLYDSEGIGVRFLGVVQDVTETRRLEEQVRQSQKLDALGTLAAGIAHDFNNILAVLRGNLSIIRSETASDTVLLPHVLDMEKACERAMELVRQILTFASHQDPDRQVLQLEQVVAEGMKLLRATLPAQIEIRTRCAADLPPVRVDANQVHQILANLGINSAHAIGRRPGTIEVQVEAVEIEADEATSSSERPPGRYVRLRFSDDGEGMPKEVIDRIFEPFFTTKAANVGTGLGLSIVRGILKSHDASISVYSEVGRGTRFDIFFPAAEKVVQGAAAAKPPGAMGHGERILYLDDEESLVLLASRMLAKMGYQVRGFSKPEQALAAFSADPTAFDLVLTDLSMPGMSGMDVARKMLEIRPDLPILLATGYVRNEDVEQARSIGIREVIWKPQTITEMADLLAQQVQMLNHPTSI